MYNIPKKVQDRIVSGLKRFQPILAGAKSRDVNESDTVTIIANVLCDVFGYDKYSEITSELAIRGTYCDLATKVNDKFLFLIEVKAIGVELKEAAVKQAVDYAANKGIDWVMLTNGNIWKIFKIEFGKPINQELILELDFQQLNPKSQNSLNLSFLLSKEGWLKNHINELAEQKQIINKYFISALLQSNNVLECLRKEFRKLSPEIKIEAEGIKLMLLDEVLKREVVEGEKIDDAKKKLAKLYAKAQKEKAKMVQQVGNKIIEQ